MSKETTSHRVTAEPPVRAITYASDDKAAAANPETDPHAAPQEAAAPVEVAKSSRKTAYKE